MKLQTLREYSWASSTIFLQLHWLFWRPALFLPQS